MPPFVSHHPCGGFEITLELAGGEFDRDFIVGVVHEHALDEVVDEVNVGRVVDGVEPNGAAVNLDENDVGERTGAEAAGNGEMKTAAHAAFLPLLFELGERERRKAFVCASATTAVADEELAVLDANFFRDPVFTGDADERTLTVGVVDAEPSPELDGLAMRSVPEGVGPGGFAFEELRRAGETFCGNEFFESGDPVKVVSDILISPGVPAEKWKGI